MARLRFDNQTGVLGATLTAGATSATLTAPWTAATVVGPDFVAIELEPSTAGMRSPNYEVVYATPVSGSATVTITARGQEGTAAVQHNPGAVWSHGATSVDFVPVVASVAGKTGAVTLIESDIGNLVTDLAAKVALATVTTKGDLIVATASAAVTRLGVGTDGQVLTADSTQTTGTTWATPSTGVVFPLTAAGDETFQPNGVASNALTLHNPASAVNGWTLTGSATGQVVTIAPAGTDAAIGATISGKGSGSLHLSVNGNLQYVDINGATGVVSTTNGTKLDDGSGNVVAAGSFLGTSPLAIAPLATGSVVVGAVAVAGQAPLTATGVTSGVNGVTITQNTSGAAPTLAATGLDANIGLTLTAKGSPTSAVTFNSPGVAGSPQLQFTAFATSWQVSPTNTVTASLSLLAGNNASSVSVGTPNYPVTFATQNSGGVGNTVNLGNGPTLMTAPSGLFIQSTSGGAIQITSDSAPSDVYLGTPYGAGALGRTALRVTSVTTSASANGLQISQATSGNAPSLATVGVDTNIDLNVAGKGTGVINFNYADQTTVGAAGAASALPAQPSKYIKVKSNGTLYVIPAYLAS